MYDSENRRWDNVTGEVDTWLRNYVCLLYKESMTKIVKVVKMFESL